MANRRIGALAAKEAMQRHGFDPVDVLVQAAQEPGANADVRLDVAKTLLPYMYPRLSNVAVDANVESTGSSIPVQVQLMQKILADPVLADAAQKISIVAADTLVEEALGGLGTDVVQ